MALQLFAVRKYPNGDLLTDDKGKPLYFHNKMEAKALRNNSAHNYPKAVVTFVPDHHSYIAGDK